MILEKYLKSLNKEDVGGFAIDSFPNPAKNKPLIGGNSDNDDEENLEEGIEEPAYDEHTKTIMIDLDGTIHKYSDGWKDGTLYDSAFGGAKQVIDQLRNDGFKVVIFTSRLSKVNKDIDNQKSMIEEWLNKNKIKVDGITSEKLPAEVYVDDRGLFFDGQWDKELYHEIKLRLREE